MSGLGGSELLIVRFMVSVLSHPATFARCWIYVPETPHVWEFCVKDPHASTVFVSVVLYFMVRFNDANESHPTAFIVLKEYKPDTVYVLPCQS